MQNNLKVLLYSHYFYPAIGGIESVSMALAEGFTDNGIECKVVTTTAGTGELTFPFEIIRNPAKAKQKELVKWADVVLFNGASLALQPWVILLRKPFIWVHGGYQVSCIDGLGWVDGVKAPLSPWSSCMYHIKRRGIAFGVRQGAIMLIKRFVARYVVDKNVAITNWVQHIQPLPNQVHIYNPFPIGQFMTGDHTEPVYDFMYLGRLVSEKGVATLLKAFAKVSQTKTQAKLLIIGDGNWREKLENLTAELGISGVVTYIGKRSGPELVNWVSKCRIAVVPSEWYEPMGGVAIELMAAGKNLIVSEYGGLKECVGNAGLSFPNGDYDALAACMLNLLNDEQLRNLQKLNGAKRIEQFRPDIFVSEYIDLIKQVAKKK